MIRGEAKEGGEGGGVTAIYGLYKAVCVFNKFRKRSGKWIKTKTHTYRISVAGRKRIKMKKMTENITGACVCRMHTEFNLPHNMQFYRFENGLVERALEQGANNFPRNLSVVC